MATSSASSEGCAEPCYENPMVANARLPDEALARWRALEGPTAPVDATARVVAWLERLRARMLCSSGRLGRLLVATGLTTLA